MTPISAKVRNANKRARDKAALDKFAGWVSMHIDIDAAQVWNFEIGKLETWEAMLKWIRVEFGEGDK